MSTIDGFDNFLVVLVEQLDSKSEPVIVCLGMGKLIEDELRHRAQSLGLTAAIAETNGLCQRYVQDCRNGDGFIQERPLRVAWGGDAFEMLLCKVCLIREVPIGPGATIGLEFFLFFLAGLVFELFYCVFHQVNLTHPITKGNIINTKYLTILQQVDGDDLNNFY